MKFKFQNIKITGILSVLPQKSVSFKDEIDNYEFTEKQCLKLAKVMGFDKRRVVGDGISISDMAIYGLRYLIDEGEIDPSEIDSLILVTQSPDHFLPPTSNIIQGKLGLKKDMICLDINQGCTGYEIGLLQAFLLLQQECIHKVILITADILSKKVSISDRNSRPIIGDAASITLIENASSLSPIYQNLKMEGKDAYTLLIPAGAFRMPSTSETGKLEKDENGNIRSKEHLFMQGDAVFNFVQRAVPPLIDELMEFSNYTNEDIDYFLFHQPNRFILEKLADKMKVSREKMPNNIVELFGNSSGSTVPVNICHNLGEKIMNQKYKVCFAGFGVGLNCSSIVMELGKLNFCKMIDFNS